MEARTGYANSGGSYLAYSVSGSGARSILQITRWTIPNDELGDEPHVSRYLRRLEALGSCIRYDTRGVGGSDPIDRTQPFDVQTMADDALAVLDAVDVERAVLIGEAAAVPAAILLAAAHPERVEALVCVNGFACMLADDDSPSGRPREFIDAFLQAKLDPNEPWYDFANDERARDELANVAPSLQHDQAFRDWYFRAARKGASPATARLLLTATIQADVRSQLATLDLPTLVVHAADNFFIPVALGRYIADHIEGAKFIEVPTADHVPWGDLADPVTDELEEFLTGKRSGTVDRVLATILFSDIVDSTGRAAALGDQRWRALLDAHDAIVRSELARYGGREVNTTGDGFVGAFDSPTQGVRAGQAMVDAAARQGVAIRVGLHTGEAERRGNDLAGLTVHIAARVGALAASGEVLVSRTVRDLVAGSGLQFVARGEQELKGVPDTWQLFALDA
ncbi:MAG TPA: adenylate/guanylate cyclase domain-containing protein [Acidimicrobiia bacterium]|nr:adenylate/guanylate cyclase domain-containing protein [Acidimicrobiia bacterium]